MKEKISEILDNNHYAPIADSVDNNEFSSLSDLAKIDADNILDDEEIHLLEFLHSVLHFSSNNKVYTFNNGLH